MRRVLLGWLLVLGLLITAAGCKEKASTTPADPVPPPNGGTGTLYDRDTPSEE